MHTRRVLIVLVALAAAVALTGCLQSPSSGPDAPPGNETFIIAVEGTSTHTLYVASYLYTETPASVTLRYENGTTTPFELADAQGLVQGPAPDGLRSVEGPEHDGGVVFEGPPAFTASANEITAMQTVVVVVRVDGSDQIAAWGVATCTGHVDRVTLDVDDRTVTVGGLACSN